jgi:hypothetical protein
MAGADILKQFAITPEKRALLNNEVHQLMPELTQYFRSLQARRQKGEVMTIEKCKDFYNYSNLLDSLMLLQAGVILPLRVSPVVKRYKLVFGDYVSENFLCFIEKQPFQEKLESQPSLSLLSSSSSSSSSSSKDHARIVLSSSKSPVQQVWIFDQLYLIICFIDITIHFISLRTPRR